MQSVDSGYPGNSAQSVSDGRSASCGMDGYKEQKDLQPVAAVCAVRRGDIFTAAELHGQRVDQNAGSFYRAGGRRRSLFFLLPAVGTKNRSRRCEAFCSDRLLSGESRRTADGMDLCPAGGRCLRPAADFEKSGPEDGGSLCAVCFICGDGCADGESRIGISVIVHTPRLTARSVAACEL